MHRRSTILLASSAFALISAPALAQSAPAADSGDSIVVTAARTILPANALPLTIDVIDQETLNQQVAIGGSIVDAGSCGSNSRSIPVGPCQSRRLSKNRLRQRHQ